MKTESHSGDSPVRGHTMSQAEEAWDKLFKSEFSRLLLENHPYRGEDAGANGWECRSRSHTQHPRMMMYVSFLHSSSIVKKTFFFN